VFGPLQRLLSMTIRSGDLEIVDGKGTLFRYGDGTGSKVRVRFADSRLEKEIVLAPQLKFGEGYMEGRIVIEAGTIYEFLAILMSNAEAIELPRWLRSIEKLRRLRKPLQQYNPVSRARRNVAHHYDIDGAIYDLFLDADRQYSCAYFNGSDSLEEAQTAKKRHIAAKLALKPGQKVLDIGSGWGGLGIYLAETCDVRIDGITLSEEQLKVSRRRVAARGLERRVAFSLTDYREVEGTYDRIVSVGMFEHVGIHHYLTYFKTIRQLLPKDGVALVHTIGRSDEPSVTNPFIAKYIFPGGYIPSMSEVLKASERSGLIVTDIEVLRLHYADTLRHWRQRFEAHRDEAKRIRDERFCRMWEFYLAASECAFRYQGLVVFQIQLARSVDSLPITRGYMEEAERALVRREGLRPVARALGE
jgi:cyclopropane-fatty-acyl-phospholipid synthase